MENIKLCLINYWLYFFSSHSILIEIDSSVFDEEVLYYIFFWSAFVNKILVTLTFLKQLLFMQRIQFNIVLISHVTVFKYLLSKGCYCQSVVCLFPIHAD